MSFEPDEITLKPDKSLTRADIEKMLQQQTDTTALNLSGLNLSVINFAEMDLRGASFVYAHMNGANLLDAHLEGSSFNSARLNGVKGHGVRLDDADLTNASLIEAKLDEASLNKAFLTRTNLSGADLRKADLSEANLSGANLSEADLTGANLTGANLSQANLSRAILHDTDLSGTDLRGAVLGGAKLDGAKLDGANLSQVRLLLANLRQARLSKAILDQTDFSWSDLGEANLSQAVLTGAKLVETDLTGADLRDADLTRANLSGSNLSEVRLVGANLQEINLSGATLSGAFLSDEQKALLQAAGDVLGLDQTRSASDLEELEASLVPPPLPEVETPHTNGVVHEDAADLSFLQGFDPAIFEQDQPKNAPDTTRQGQTANDLEASAGLPSLTGVLHDIDQTAPDMGQASTDFAETELQLPPLSPVSNSFGDNATRIFPTTPVPNFAAPEFFGVSDSTVSLVVTETPLTVSGLTRLLGGLERLHTALGLIREEQFAGLIEFYHSPSFEARQNGGLILISFDLMTGLIELTCDNAASIPALNSLLAGITNPGEEFGARELADSILENFVPGLDPVAKAMTAQLLAGTIEQIGSGPNFELAGSAAQNKPAS